MLRIFDETPDSFQLKAGQGDVARLDPAQPGLEYITIPDAHLLFSADVRRSGSDLLLTGDDGRKVTVSDYFRADKRPTLLSPEGAAFSPDVIDMLVGHKQFAQAGGPAGTGVVIGRVERVSGSVQAVRNGVAVTLNQGDNVYRADVIQTGIGATVGISFTDGSAFNLTANTRIALTDYAYDPNGAGNTSLLSLVQGTATFVSGQVARIGNMRVETPTATLGIRGTAWQSVVAQDGTVQLSVLQQDNQIHTIDIIVGGRVIGQARSDGGAWTITPSGPLQAIAQETAKTPQVLQQEFAIVQQVLNTQQLGNAIYQGPPQPPAPPPPAPPNGPTPPTTPDANPGGGNNGNGSGTPLLLLQNDTTKGSSTPPAIVTLNLEKVVDQPNTTLVTIVTPPAPPAPPVEPEANSPPTGKVAITATGNVLTADLSGLIDLDNGIGSVTSYKWERVTSSSVVIVQEGSDPNYELKPEDNGAFLRVVVSYVDGKGHLESVTSDGVTEVVTPPNLPPFFEIGPHITRVSVPSALPSGADAAAVHAIAPAMSYDGRFVVFFSTENTPGQAGDQELHGDVFLYDRQTGETKILTDDAHIPSRPDGEHYSGFSINSSGRYVVFKGEYTVLDNGPNQSHTESEIYVYDRLTDQTRLLTDSQGNPFSINDEPRINAAGLIVFTRQDISQQGAVSHLEVVNLFGQVLTDVTPATLGIPDPGQNLVVNLEAADISGNGRFVTFWAVQHEMGQNSFDPVGTATLYYYDRVAHTAQVIGTATASNDNWWASMSFDGRYVAFQSDAALVAGDTNDAIDIFVYDTVAHTTQRVSVGGTADGDSIRPKISPDGRYVIFASNASKLVADDTNDQPDTFVYDRQTHTIQLLSQSVLALGDGDSSFGEALSVGGVFAAFGSSATNLVDNDGNGVPDNLDPNGTVSDVFVVDTAGGAHGLVLDNPSLTTLSTRGQLAFGDTDDTDHTVLFVAKAAGSTGQQVWGTLDSLEVTTDTVSGPDGIVSWHYQVNEALARQLMAGERHIDTFTITLSDGAGNQATQDIAVTIIGTNLVPTTAATPPTATLVEAGVDNQGAPVAGVSTSSVTISRSDPNGDPTSFVLTGWTPVAPDGSAVAYNGHYYEFVFASTSWSGAQAQAAAMGGYLATITSAGENDFIFNNVVAGNVLNGSTAAYIGASDQGHEGIWQWAVGPEAGQVFWDHGIPFAYANWRTSSGEPSNGGGVENFGAMEGDGTWNDAPQDYSSNTTGFVVEFSSYRLDGKYGYVILNTASGQLTYHLDNDDPDTQALAAGASVTDGFDIQVTDDRGAVVTQHVAFTIQGTNDAPTVANVIPDQGATQGSPVSFTFGANTFNDVDAGDTLTYTAALASGAALPGWLSFNAATRTFSGTPANGDVGTISVRVTATDTGNASVSDTFDITVGNTNDAPVIQNVGGTVPVNEDNSVLLAAPTASVTDADGDTLTMTVSVAHGTLAPSAAILTAIANNTLTALDSDGSDGSLAISGSAAAITAAIQAGITYTPGANFNGADALSVQISDGHGGTTSASVAINVAPVNDAPVNAVPGSQTVAEDTNLSITGLSVSDVDAAGASITTTLSVAHGTLTVASAGGAGVSGSGTGTVTLTGTVTQINTTLAAANNVVYRGVANFNGSDALTITTNDGGASGSGGAQQDQDTVAITVTAVNDAPDTNPGSGSGNEDTTIAVSLSGSDIDGTVASFKITSLPASGTLFSDAALTQAVALNGVVAATGNAATVYFVPALNFNGPLSFQYAAVDNNGATDATPAIATIAVAPVNDAPTVANIIPDQGATQGGPFSFTFGANTFNDVDVGDTLTYGATLASGAALPGWLSFNAATRTFSGTPANGDVGTISVKVTATDTGNASVSDTFDITVGNTNDAPVLDATKTPVLGAQIEDAPTPSGAVGTLISSLVDFASPSGQVDNVTDADAGALTGIALIGTDTANGTWFYTINGGNTWTAVGTVSATSALLLAADANTRLYFRPTADFNGAVNSAITFRAWDQTSGGAGSKVDTSSNGGATAFSTATDTAAITVTPVNDAPTILSTIVSMPAFDEDTAPTERSVASLYSSQFQDVDSAASFSGITVSLSSGPSPTLVGVWQYKTADVGATWHDITFGQSNQYLVLDPTTLLRFVPVADFNGSANLSVGVIDNTYAGGFTSDATQVKLSSPILGGTSAFSNTKPLSQPVNAIDDAPVFSNFGPPAANTEQTASLLDSDTNATVFDAELSAIGGAGGAGNWAGSTLTVARHGGASAQDSFGFNTGLAGALFTVSGNQLQSGGLTFATFTNSGGVLTINFTGSGTAATNTLVNKVVERITYTNTSDTPPASVQLDLAFNDGNTANAQGAGGAQIGTASVVVNITPVNDAPAIAESDISFTVVEEQIAPVQGRFHASDAENNPLTWTAGHRASAGAPVDAGVAVNADYFVTLDSLAVVKNGSQIFYDGFDDGLAPPSAPTFSNGNLGSYFTDGTFFEGQGRLIMVGRNASAPFDSVFGGQAVHDAAILNTDTQPISVSSLGLKSNADFEVAARFDLSMPEDPTESYGIRLIDSIGDATPGIHDNDYVGLLVRRSEVAGGPVEVVLVHIDRSANTYDIAPERYVLSPPAGVDQIELRLTHDNANPGIVHASFDLLDDGVVVGSVVNFAATETIFHGEDWTRAQIVTTSPVENDSVFVSDYGVLYVDQDGNWLYNLRNGTPAVQQLGAGDTVIDHFAVQVSDGNGGVTTRDINVTVTGVNDAPTITGDLSILVNRSGFVRLTAADLQAVDPDNGASELTYTVTHTSGGHLAFASALGTAITNFTQADLAAGSVAFVQDGSDVPWANFAVAVADTDGGTTPVATVVARVSTITVQVLTAAGFNFDTDNPIAAMGSGAIQNTSTSHFTITNAAAHRYFVFDGAFNADFTNGPQGTITAIHEFNDVNQPLIDFTGNIDAASFYAATVAEAAGNHEVGNALTADWTMNFVGNAGSDGFASGSGDDNFVSSGGNDFYDGQFGYDHVAYGNQTAAITVQLAAGTVTKSAGGTDTLSSVEMITGTNFVDTFNAVGFNASSPNAGSTVTFNTDGTLNQFEGRGGNDIIIGNGNTRISYSHATAGVVVTFTGWTTGVGAFGTAVGDASVGTDTFTGVSRVRGSYFDDVFIGSSNDANTTEVFEGRGGNDLINGGGGSDRAVYANDDAGIVVHLAAGKVVGGPSTGTDTLLSVEFITGTDFADTYIADVDPNINPATNQAYSSVAFGDLAAANVGSNGTLNEFEGLGGNDTVIGNGNTRVSYTNATAGVTVTLGANGSGTAEGSAHSVLAPFANVDPAGVGSDTFVNGVSRIRGSEFNDLLTGNSGNNVVEGRGGNDALSGLGGDDTLTGGTGADRFVYATGGGNDVITDFDHSAGVFSHDEGDRIDLRSAGVTGIGQITLTGGTFTGTNFVAGTGPDTLITSASFGGSGNSIVVTGVLPTVLQPRDFLFAGQVAITVQTSDGYDFGTLYDDLAGVNPALTAHDATHYVVANPTAGLIFSLISNNGFTYDVNGNPTGGAVNTIAILDSSYHSLVNTNGWNFQLTSLLSAVQTYATTQNASGLDTIFVTSPTYSAIGSSHGQDNNDTFTGDTFISSSHNDFFNGLTDFFGDFNGGDTVDYSRAVGPVTVDLASGSATGGGGNDTLVNIENIRGSSFNDTLTGQDFVSNVLEGGPGDDTLDGGGGWDTASYEHAVAGVTVSLAISGPQNTIGAGTDTLVGSSFGKLLGSSHNDTLTGNGQAMLEGGAGADHLIGQSGRQDYASYEHAATGVIANLSTPAQNTGDAAGDSYTDINNLFGSRYNDVLTGNGNANVLDGGFGGHDVLTGLAGADTFVFHGGQLTVADFSHAAGDVIDVADYANFLNLNETEMSALMQSLIAAAPVESQQIDFGDGQVLTLNVNVHTLNTAVVGGDFIFSHVGQ